MKVDLYKLKSAQKQAKLELKALKEAGFNTSDANASVDDVREQFDILKGRKPRRTIERNSSYYDSDTSKENNTLVVSTRDTEFAEPSTLILDKSKLQSFNGAENEALELAGFISNALASRSDASVKKIVKPSSPKKPAIAPRMVRRIIPKPAPKQLPENNEVKPLGSIAGRSKTGLFSWDRNVQERLRNEALAESDAKLQKLHSELLAKVSAEKEQERKKKLERLYGPRAITKPQSPSRLMKPVRSNVTPGKVQFSGAKPRSLVPSQLFQKPVASPKKIGTKPILSDTGNVTMDDLFSAINQLKFKIESLEKRPTTKSHEFSGQNKEELLEYAMRMLGEMEAKDLEWQQILDQLERSRVEQESPILLDETIDLVSDDSTNDFAEQKYTVSTEEKRQTETSGHAYPIAMNTAQTFNIIDYKEATGQQLRQHRYKVGDFIIPKSINLSKFIANFSNDLINELLENASNELAITTEKISKDLYNQELYN